ncbi:MAG: putative DNA binding domain-containing protein [Thermoflexales bacterium]|nr:putative DNA binding domain-containing protein [Thermoflexales bacterium]
MIEHELRQLIQQGESLLVEFKGEQARGLSDDDLIEAVVCLANRPDSRPAWLILGVEDDGRITGARPRHGNYTDLTRLQALIANRTRPSLTCHIDEFTLDGKVVILIAVPQASTPVCTAAGTYKRRSIDGRGKPACLPFLFYEMQTHQASQGQDYSALVVPEASWEDLDPLEFDRLRRFVEVYNGDRSLSALQNDEIAKALGAVESNHDIRGIRVLGLLLFGKEQALGRLLPSHEIAFQVFSGSRVTRNEFLRVPLLRAMEILLERFRALNNEQELVLDLFRVSIPDYAERAFREGLANALVHRDYARLGAVHIQWHDDHMEISNPGGFPEGVRLDNLLVTPPRPRNPRLADAFKRIGIVERTGRGIDTIFYEQLRNGRPAPSYARSTESDVVLVLPGGEANLKFVRLVVEQGRTLQRALRLEELLVLNHLWQVRRAQTPDLARLIQRPDAEALALLQRMVEAGLIEAHGERKGRTWHLSNLIYKALDGQEAYLRQRGLSQLQQEQLILDYVETHGSITRGEASELCKVSPSGAYTLLQDLCRRGHLIRRGRAKGSRYTFPNTG